MKVIIYEVASNGRRSVCEVFDNLKTATAYYNSQREMWDCTMYDWNIDGDSKAGENKTSWNALWLHKITLEGKPSEIQSAFSSYPYEELDIKYTTKTLFLTKREDLKIK